MGHLLDNPIWNSLTGSRHGALAHHAGAAARYRSDVSQLAAVAEATPAALADLAGLVEADASVLVLGLEGLEDVGPHWTRPFALPLLQMVLDVPLESPDQEFLTLGPEDEDEAMALVELTEPGPFLPGTLQLGLYLGLRKEGRLIAMAGERMNPMATPRSAPSARTPISKDAASAKPSCARTLHASSAPDWCPACTSPSRMNAPSPCTSGWDFECGDSSSLRRYSETRASSVEGPMPGTKRCNRRKKDRSDPLAKTIFEARR